MRQPPFSVLLLATSTLFLVVSESFQTTRAANPTPRQAFQQPNTYALVIGISQYREEVIPKVPYAVKDAEEIAQLLETQGGIPKTNIKLLTDAKATIGDLRSHFGDWLRMRVKPDSTVYVYYSGHGTPNPKTGETYLVPWDGHPDFPSGLYPLNELYEILNKLPAKDAIVFLDSCFSGAGARSVLPKGARPVGISVENPLLAGGKVVVLAAANGNQISSDYEKAEHGLFTHYLLRGLRGEADADHDKLVSLGELALYIRKRVERTALDELNREQSPILLPGEGALRQKMAMALARKRNHRERMNLRGPVRNVTEEHAGFHWEGPRWVEKPKKETEVDIFDAEGTLIKASSEGMTTSFDSEGKPTESFDPSIGRVQWPESEASQFKDNYENNWPRNTIRKTDTVLEVFDDRGNKIESGIYGEDGKLATHLFFTYEEFDLHGNWTKRTCWRDLYKKNEKFQCGVYYRTITYYETK